jgi:hypothetical protein
MPISAVDVVVGGIYATATNQHRRVVKIVGNKVYYDSRGGNVMSAWGPGHLKSSPPSLESFVAACERVISKPAVAKPTRKRKRKRKKAKSAATKSK